MQKKAQVTLFIIIAIVIVAFALLAFLFLKPQVTVPSKLQPAENYFKDCVDVKVKEASQIAGMQGGYIDMPEFEAGSEYMPFSNQLNYLGMSVPYWFYVSGNNLARERKPSLASIESEFENYLSESVKECDFTSIKSEGYQIEISGEPAVDVKIKGSSIETNVAWAIKMAWDEQSIVITNHKITTKSNFGALYNDAGKIFTAEQKTLFLENYSVDVLRLYAPVDDIELSCAPKIWQVSEVKQELKSALEGNIAALKVKGSDYSLAKPENKYFEVDVGTVSSNAYFLYVPAWNSRIEVWPTEGEIMKAEPIGMQEGLGILGMVGLCYVPYHFVYDVYYPVVVQLNKNGELFQFATVVVIDKSVARNATVSESSEVEFDICNYKTQEAKIFSYDENSVPVEADVSFKCFNQVCNLGRTKMIEGKAKLETLVPQCYNGFIIAKAQGFKESRLMFTTTEPVVLNMFLAPTHELDVEMPNLRQGEYALISFSSQGSSSSIYYPEQKKINLSEGNYNVTVYVYKEASITIGAQKGETCVKIPVEGIGGMMGQMQEQCYELDVPQQSFTNVLFGGGQAQFFVTESDLKGKSKISLVAETSSIPANLNDLIEIYSLIGASQVNIQLK